MSARPPLTSENERMIIRRLHGDKGGLAPAEAVAFQARLNDDDRHLLKVAREKLRAKLGGEPSNPVLLAEMLKAYTAQAA